MFSYIVLTLVYDIFRFRLSVLILSFVIFILSRQIQMWWNDPVMLMEQLTIGDISCNLL